MRVSRAADAVIALALYAVLLAELTLRPLEPMAHPATLWAFVFGAGLTLPFAVHRRFPLTAILVTAGCVIAYAAGHYNGYPGWAVMVLVFATSLHADRRLGTLALAAGLGSMSIALALQPAPVVSTGTWVATLILTTAAWLVGEAIRTGNERWTAAQEALLRAEREREERARQAVAAERLRIARELHDVVAHSMSVIAVQAGVAGHVIDTRPELAKDALSTVETLTRSALAEMRRLLGVLRTADEPSAALAPSPGLADLPELVSGLAIAGLPVDLQLDGDRGQVPAGADLSGYRIVQEALTNVLRHGGPAARVLVHCTPGAVEIDVQDAGRPAVNGAAGPTSQAGNGHGLIGMRERVAVFGGQLSAGPSRGGGYRVHAVLPFDEPAATR